MAGDPDEMSRSLGRVEGKLDVALSKLDRVERAAESFASTHGVEKIEARVQKLEATTNRTAGVSAAIAAVVGILVSLVKPHLLPGP